MDQADPGTELTGNMIVEAYSFGAFPMACTPAPGTAPSPDPGGTIDWFSPDPRAILPLEPGQFHVSRSLRRRVRSGHFTITRDRAFDRVIAHCAEPRPGSPGTWINQDIIRAYCQLHQTGEAHSIEAWREATPGQSDDSADPGYLVGGIYGVALGGAFFAESMFSRDRDASKVCLVHLVQHLRAQRFTLMDVQYTTPHLQQFGVVEIRRKQYVELLNQALPQPVSW